MSKTRSVVPQHQGEGGRTVARDYEDHGEATIAGIGRAVLALIAAVFLVFGGIMALGGKIF